MKIQKKLILLIPAFALASMLQAQTTKTPATTASPSKSMKMQAEEEKTVEDKKSVEKEEKYVWNYSVVEVYGQPGAYQVVFAKPTGEITAEEKRNYMMAERIQAASDTYKSEADLLKMFTNLEMELVTVLIEDSPKGPKKVFYLRKKTVVPQ